MQIADAQLQVFKVGPPINDLKTAAVGAALLKEMTYNGRLAKFESDCS